MLENAKAKRHLSKDLKLREVISGVKPLNLEKSGNVFNELVKAIAYQQISYKAADSIYARFLQLIGGEFFSPKELCLLSVGELRSVGLSRQKAHYCLNIAEFFEEKDLFACDWTAYSDKEIIDLLTQIKGVGKWTVQMVLIFELHRADVFPEKDLGVQLAMKAIYNLKEEKTALVRKIIEISDSWAPYRTLGSLYMWAWKREN